MMRECVVCAIAAFLGTQTIRSRSSTVTALTITCAAVPAVGWGQASQSGCSQWCKPRTELSTGACCHRQLTAHLLALSKCLDLTDCKRRDNRWRLQTDGEAQTSTETIMLILMGKMHSTLGALPWPLPCVISRGTKAWESSLCGAARCSRLRMFHFRVFRYLTTSAVSGVPIKPVERPRQLQRGVGL